MSDPGSILGPFFFLFGIFAVIFFALYLRNRESERRHQERLKAMELGIAVPSEPIGPARKRAIWLVLGILSISIAIPFAGYGVMLNWDQGSAEHIANSRERMGPIFMSGLLFCFGIGSLITHFVVNRKNGT